MKRTAAMALAAAFMFASVGGGVAEAKGKPASPGKKAKKQPTVAYVFKGEVAAVDADSVIVQVEKGNKFARGYVGQELDAAVDGATKINKDDARATLADLEAGDGVVVKARELKGATTFTARIVNAESPVVEEEPAPEESTEPAPTEPAV